VGVFVHCQARYRPTQSWYRAQGERRLVRSTIERRINKTLKRG
jgi:hypothetical protein